MKRIKFITRDFFILSLFCLFLIFSGAACNPEPSSYGNQTVNSANKPVATPTVPAVNTSNTGDAIPEILPGLEAKFYEDADGNAIPNFMEIEMGKDPLKNDCPGSNCGDPAELLNYFQSPHNTLLMLDSSGSMRANNKIQSAKNAIKNYASMRMPENFKAGFLVYGHRGDNSESGKAASCAGIELLTPIGELKPENVEGILQKFEPTGWTPIGASLEQAANAFAGMEGQDNRIVLVSDGIETCGGDPVAVARRLHEEGFKVIVDVVGFGVETKDAAELKKIADAGGGEYVNARTQRELYDYFQKRNAAFHQTLEAMQCSIKNVAIQSNVCDQSMTNQAALFRIMPLVNKARAEGRDDEVKALESLRQRIEALRDKRKREVEASQQKIKELTPKINEFYERMRQDKALWER